MDEFLDELTDAGLAASRTHFGGTTFKTDGRSPTSRPPSADHRTRQFVRMTRFMRRAVEGADVTTLGNAIGLLKIRWGGPRATSR